MNEPLHEILANASLSHRKKCRQEFQKLNLSEGQPKVLACLLRNPGIVQKELAGICFVEPATMTSLLRKMEQDSLIQRKQVTVSGGKRANCIYLTEKGHQLAVATTEIMKNAEQLAFTDFSPEQRELFLFLIKKLTDNLS